MSASAVTKRKRDLYIQWLYDLEETIPCEHCRIHYIDNLKNLPVEPYMDNNISLFYHSWKMHDIVNEQTNKAKHLRLSYEEAFEIYFGKPKPLTETAQLEDMKYDQRYEIEEECNGGCGEPTYEVENTNFEEYRTINRTKFSTKNSY